MWHQHISKGKAILTLTGQVFVSLYRMNGGPFQGMTYINFLEGSYDLVSFYPVVVDVKIELSSVDDAGT